MFELKSDRGHAFLCLLAGITFVTTAIVMASPEFRLLVGPTSSKKLGIARGKAVTIKPRLLSSDA
ncbi:unnamed protein product [Clonostachys chloroleuca]|uniref:Uncharacterized protein n=1 Tax=Clonostachys chloroleuca TaxID=1926264 RepID=A0AA35MHF4_9HYPO|nr:unnamed protein product [Clonostachys chloroleuca]